MQLILLVVNVTVLLEQITIVQHSVSTLSNLQIIAFFLVILRTPKAKHTVMTEGKSLGIVATANGIVISK